MVPVVAIVGGMLTKGCLRLVLLSLYFVLT